VLTVGDYEGLYAVIPTPALPTTGWDSDCTVDYDETARVVDQLVSDGASGLVALGTTGECATLGVAEYERVVRCITETVNGRVPTLIGSSALAWSDIRARLAILAEAGATGTLLGLPQWQPMTQTMAVTMYSQVSAQFPKLTVMVYANQRAFRFPFADSADFWAALVDIAPTVTSAKFSRPKTLAALREASRGRIHFMPNESKVLDFVDIAGDAVTSCWATAASMGPEPILALMDAVVSGRRDAAVEIDRSIAWASEPVDGLIADPAVFASYNIQIEKARINAAGYCAAGPVRPPYDHLPLEYLERATECGRRWREIRSSYTTTPAVVNETVGIEK
jgi:trans-o-hydroxybenzylidenepyruvate hydratase-aldolase